MKNIYTILLVLILFGCGGDNVLGPTGKSSERLIKEGWAFYESKEYTGALAKFNDAVKINPNEADIYNGLGWTHFALHNIQQSIFQFGKGVENNPKFLDILVGYSFVHYENNNYSLENGSLKWASEAIAIDSAKFDSVGSYSFIHNSKVTAEEFRKIMTLSYFYIGKFEESYTVLREYLNGEELDTTSIDFSSNLLKELNRVCNE